MLVCDFFSVDTVLLRRLYVLFFIALDTRMIHLADITATRRRLGHPAGEELCFGLAGRAYAHLPETSRDGGMPR
ncbi:MAG: hypothetical protein ABSD85_16375 [Acidimicrobiales bacterium]|jgi:hypothetical protein